MSQWNSGPTKSFPCSIAIPNRSRVILSAGVLALAGANDRELGVIEQSTLVATYGAAQFNAPVRLRTAQGTEKMIATGAISQGAVVYADANGGTTATVGTVQIGIALSAATANGDIIEVLRMNSIVNPVAALLPGLRIARGQQTTVTAADTVVTGLTTVLTAVASEESDPVLTVSQVSCQVGNQSGAPVAGSIVIKTWEPTSVSNPTPIAATTFGKLVNWIAIGY